MTKAYIDTNVILDLLAKREPFYKDSSKIFSLADLKEVSLVISSLSIMNTHYVLHEGYKIKNARELLGRFKVLLEIYPLNDKIIDLALNDYDFKDFEDGVQYYTALESKCDVIITRNIKDYKKSRLPVLSPTEFSAKMV